MFEPLTVDRDILKKRAYNLRWATLPEDIIPLTAADPDFPCAPEITEAISRYSRPGYFSYGPAEGLPEFRESMAAYFSDKRHIPVTSNLILPVDSAAFGIFLTCKAFLNKGDEAIIFDPVDFLFRYSIEQTGAAAIPFAIPAGTEAIDFSKLEKLIGKRTKMICLCNPLNPTGKVFTKQELHAFAALALKHKLIILSDEIWSEITYAPHVFTSIASLGTDVQDCVVTITGFSKSHGLAGLRIGAIACTSKEVYDKLFVASLHASTVHGVNILSQVAAASALTECEYWLSAFLSHLQKMRDLAIARLNMIPGFTCISPEGCYVAFVNIAGTGKTSAEIHDILFRIARVAVVPGLREWFGDGARDHIRLSFATSEEILTDALYRIKRSIDSL